MSATTSAVSSSSRPRRRPTGASRERIIEEAEHLLHLRGYLGTSLDDIAARCRMGKANLLHHFRSKEELCLAVLDYKIGAMRKDCLDCFFPEGADPARSVEALFASASRFFTGNGCKAGCFVANMALEMSDLSDRFRDRVRRFFDEWAGRIEATLRAAQVSGAYGPGLDPRAAAEAVLSLYEGAVMLARARRDPSVFERVGRQAAALLETHRAPTARDIREKGGDSSMGPKTPCGC